jgi:hypothetical protein
MHIGMGPKFGSVEEFARFLDLPPESEEVTQQIKLLEHQIDLMKEARRFRSP